MNRAIAVLLLLSVSGLTESQQAGIMRAARAVETSAVENERATAIYHTSLNRSLNMTVHEQTQAERDAWESEFSAKVETGIVEASNDPEVLSHYIKQIRGL
jgi:hypothetical protein